LRRYLESVKCVRIGVDVFDMGTILWYKCSYYTSHKILYMNFTSVLLCCTDTVALKWTRHVDTWQILKNTYDTCVGHVSDDTTLWQECLCYIGMSHLIISNGCARYSHSS